MIRIGLTGGIAAGKSTVARHLAQLGAVIIDYDQLARRIVEPGGEALPRIVVAFGPQSIGSDGRLNRHWIAEQVFGPQARPGAREQLDAIEHPLIYQAAQQQESAISQQDTRAVVVHDIPLLAEVIDAIPFAFDHIATVEADEDTRVRRMQETRGMSEDESRARIASQSPRSARLAISDTVIDANVDESRMFDQVDGLFLQWFRQAHAEC